MTARKGLVLDANILLPAVFGQRVRQILEAYKDQANLYAPGVCFHNARKYIPDLSTRRRIDVDLALSVLDPISLSFNPSTKAYTRTTKRSLALESCLAILTIGLLRRWRCCSAFRSGPKIKTSLAAA